MAWFLFVAEIATEDSNGAPVGTGRYRRIAKSDEDGGTHALCSCEGGHVTREEAYDCLEAAAKSHFYGLPAPRRGR